MEIVFRSIELETEKGVGTLWLNRPEIHNAFNESMIAEITEAFHILSVNDEVRLILLRGRGKSFCAGADLNWMRDVAGYTYEQNYRESIRLCECFHNIYNCPKPTIAVVHGAAIGGANGLIAACDMAYAAGNSVFSLSEVKIGLVPACISPYVIKRTGESVARELMLTGRRINGSEAEQCRLVNRSWPEDELMPQVEKVMTDLLSSGPRAMNHCKSLINEVSNRWTLAEAIGETARIIADIRASDEGQEGMRAFLEKRKPGWINIEKE